MFKELYDGLIEMIRTGDAEDIGYMEDDMMKHSSIPITLNLTQDDIPVENIMRIRKIQLPDIPPVLFVLVREEEFGMIRTPSVLYIDGRLTIVTYLDYNWFTSEVKSDNVGFFLYPLISLNNLIMKMTASYIYRTSAHCLSMYAPFIITAKILDKLYPDHEYDDALREAMSGISIVNITDSTIDSIRKINEEFTIKYLLDNSYLLGALGDDAYPGLDFLVTKKSEEVNVDNVNDAGSVTETDNV